MIDAGVVIFAAGVRPRDELARAAGLTVAERGGVLTDLSCQTGDPDIYAVGEVAAIGERGSGRPAAGRRRRQLRRRDGGMRELPRSRGQCVAGVAEI